ALLTAVKPVEILVVQERRDRDAKARLLQRGDVVVMPHSTARPLSPVSTQQQDRMAHSATHPERDPTFAGGWATAVRSRATPAGPLRGSGRSSHGACELAFRRTRSRQ